MHGLLNKTCEYAVNAVVFLAGQPDDTFFSQGIIARRAGVPHHFIGKILQTLSKKDLIISVKGKNGGFKLGRPAKRIKLIEIIESIDGPGFLEGCMLGLGKCEKDESCYAHSEWKKIKSRIKAILNKDLLQFSQNPDKKAGRKKV
ncbi:RrF2 family transcriptional regulator [Fibrobacterota bacterium]